MKVQFLKKLNIWNNQYNELGTFKTNPSNSKKKGGKNKGIEKYKKKRDMKNRGKSAIQQYKRLIAPRRRKN